LPYESVKIICYILYPGFSSNPLNVIAICDACMMLFNPGVYLYDALVEMAKNSFNYSDPRNIYKHIYSKTKFKYNGHTAIQQLLISQGALAINQLSDYFTTPLFRDNKMWINYVISSGIDLRITHPFLMIEIASNGKILSERVGETERTIENIFFNEIRHKLGSPLVVNDFFEMTFNSTSYNDFDVLPEYFWAINQVYKIYSKPLNNGTYKCEMIEWCNNSCLDQGIEEYTDERCRNAPWERANDSDPNPCTLGRLWKSWGLMNEYPV
ncbi:MAG: hypothetical protein IT265_11870, partial [Saprospiraceae bacterium]|nr:hypothetical protein [Saprospiraceae bacterium]